MRAILWDRGAWGRFLVCVGRDEEFIEEFSYLDEGREWRRLQPSRGERIEIEIEEEEGAGVEWRYAVVGQRIYSSQCFTVTVCYPDGSLDDEFVETLRLTDEGVEWRRLQAPTSREGEGRGKGQTGVFRKRAMSGGNEFVPYAARRRGAGGASPRAEADKVASPRAEAGKVASPRAEASKAERDSLSRRAAGGAHGALSAAGALPLGPGGVSIPPPPPNYRRN